MTAHVMASADLALDPFGLDDFDMNASRPGALGATQLVRYGASPLVVVTDVDDSASHDASVVALASAVSRRLGAWVDRTSPTMPGDQLSERDYERFRDYIRRIVLPIQHHRGAIQPPDRQGLLAYRKVNRAYALAASAAAAPCATVVVYGHGLHLVPRLLRHLRPDLRTGIFVHDLPDIHQVHHWTANREMIAGLLGADLIGLPSHAAVSYLARQTEKLLGSPTALAGMEPFRSTCGDAYVGAFPTSVDTRSITNLASHPEIRQHSLEVRARLGGPRHVLLSIDSEDDPSGAFGSLQTVRQLLLAGTVRVDSLAVIQIMPPAAGHPGRGAGRDVRRLAEQINAEVGRTRRPIVHMIPPSRGISQRVAVYLAADSLAAATSRASDCPWVLEYVAARRGSGAVVLNTRSNRAGMLADATLFDSRDAGQLARELTRVILGGPEGAQAMARMYAQVSQYDCHAWARALLGSLRWRERAVTDSPDNRRWPTGHNAARPARAWAVIDDLNSG